MALFGAPVPGKYELQQFLAPVTGLVGWGFGVVLAQPSEAAALAGLLSAKWPREDPQQWSIKYVYIDIAHVMWPRD